MTESCLWLANPNKKERKGNTANFLQRNTSSSMIERHDRTINAIRYHIYQLLCINRSSKLC